MEDEIKVGDKVRARYAKPTSLFEVVELRGKKVGVKVLRQWNEASPAEGEIFELSADLLLKA